MKAKLVKNKYLYLKGNNYLAYKLIIESNGMRNKLYIFQKARFSIELERALNVLLRVNEIYIIKFLSKSNLITEIESVTYPDLNIVIEDCFIKKNVSKKERQRAFPIC